MERVECFVTLRTAAKQVVVYPLDGAGRRQEALPEVYLQRTESGIRIHLQAEGQTLTPWFEIEAAF
jgi:hypothetical protein